MHASTLARRELGGLEATILHTYPDATGTPTIGTGHTAAAGPPVPTPGMTITATQADATLAVDLAKVYDPAVNRRVKEPARSTSRCRRSAGSRLGHGSVSAFCWPSR